MGLGSLVKHNSEYLEASVNQAPPVLILYCGVSALTLSGCGGLKTNGVILRC